jgi:hypothetical protein
MGQNPLSIRPIAHAIWDPHFGQVGPFQEKKCRAMLESNSKLINI